MTNITIALDVMSGDVGGAGVGTPMVVREALRGAELFLRECPDATKPRILLFGRLGEITKHISRLELLCRHGEIVDVDEVVPMDSTDTHILRARTSMSAATLAVRDSAAAGVVSAGNTLIYGQMAGLWFGRFGKKPRQSRPGLIANSPTVVPGRRVLLGDVGMLPQKNPFDPQRLVETIFQLASVAKARGVPRPKIAFYNIGEEARKGPQYIRDAKEIVAGLRDPGFDLINLFFEPPRVFSGEADAIVFSAMDGNGFIKTAAAPFREVVKPRIEAVVRRSWVNKIVYGFTLKKLFAEPDLKDLDSQRANGAYMTGLAGLAVKIHGNAEAVGYAAGLHALFMATSHERAWVELMKEAYENYIRFVAVENQG